MQRLAVLGVIGTVVCACGAPIDGRVNPPAAPLDDAEHAGIEAQPPVEDQPRLDTRAIVDTSIATVWAAPPPPTEPPPRVPAHEREHVAIAVPRARIPGRRAPCFAHRDVLVGAEVWRDLQPYAISMSSETPPSGRYGTCTIADGQLRDARGTLIAELHCGITVYVRGIIDHLGYEIGARGADIAAEYATAPTICWADGDKHTRCWFETGEETSHYTFAGTPAMPEHGPLRDPDARGFVTSRTVARFTVRMSCH